ncbi:MAG: translocation/assembly module TamB domain-containing protein, partial [Saprospiraceae bacterium]
VKLKMMLTGSLLQPDIRFDIDMPDLTGQLKNFADNKIRYLRTNQDQLNQQVFGLLVLRTFLNSFDPTEIGSNLSTTTINTMSEMLSNQFSLFVTSLLSNAFDDVNFISGVDFNIGYDFDNTIPGSSKFNEGEVVFSLKHRLWNDQWIVTLGGNYKSSSSSIYGNSYFNPESIIEWNTPVPGLKLRIYYRGDESIEGLKHKIGTGISYRKEFDSFFDFKKELNSKAKTRNKNSIE